MILFIYLFIYFRERGIGGEKEGEKHRCARETSIGCLSHVPCLGIELSTFCLMEGHSINWAIQVMARIADIQWFGVNFIGFNLIHFLIYSLLQFQIGIFGSILQYRVLNLRKMKWLVLVTKVAVNRKQQGWDLTTPMLLILKVRWFSPEDPKSNNVKRGNAGRLFSQPTLRNPYVGCTHHLFLVEISGRLGTWSSRHWKWWCGKF